MVCSWTAESGSTGALSPAPRRLAPQGRLGWLGRPADGKIIGVFRQPAAGGSRLRLLTCLWGRAGSAGTCWAGLEAVITGAL